MSVDWPCWCAAAWGCAATCVSWPGTWLRSMPRPERTRRSRPAAVRRRWPRAGGRTPRVCGSWAHSWSPRPRWTRSRSWPFATSAGGSRCLARACGRDWCGTGTGGLLAEDIFCLADGPRALDCLDFDDRLRWMDVLDDVATLAMDLERLGALQAAQSWLSDYAEFSGVRQPLSLSHHYIAYRAVMRAKVAAIVERGSAQADSAAAAEQTRALALLGLSHLRAGRVRLILLGGGPASGKSTFAEGLGDAIPAAALSSDRVRKELSGIPPTQHMPARFGEGIYTPESTSKTYQRLADQAERLLALGETVVVDASFSTGEQRELLRSAGQRTSAQRSA